MSRRWLVPEVVQTSAMDCGPASLAALMAGLGLPASYGRLREACQTDVDGTSIDTLEEVALQLGLAAEQVMLPADHLLLDEAQSLPAIVVVVLPGGTTHFVVVWRRLGAFVQIMDPALGRRWLRASTLLGDLLRHRQPVPAADWREWAGTAEFTGVLAARAAALGVGAADFAPLLETALADPGWRPLALLDAAVRAVAELCAVGGVGRGSGARALVESFVAGRAEVPEGWWFVTEDEVDEDGELWLHMRGAVLLRVRGLRSSSTEASEDLPPISTDLQAALDAAEPAPVAALLDQLGPAGRRTGAWLGATLAVAALGAVAEAVLFRGLLDLPALLPGSTQRLGAVGALLAFAVLLLLLELPVAVGLRRLGRLLETRMRMAFLRKIPRLGDRYFASRLISDMAERAHSSQKLRELPLLVAAGWRDVAAILATAGGMVWLAPAGAPLTLAAAAVCVGLPVAAMQALSERDLRLRTHAGALTRLTLDAFLGLTAIRTHGAARAVRREFEGLLTTWGEAGLSLQRMAVVVEGLQAAVGLVLAAVLVQAHVHSGGGVGGGLLLAWWALQLPALGERLALALRQVPSARSATLRLLEPLGAPEAEQAGETPAAASAGPVSVELRDLRVVAGGHTILDGVSLRLAPGEHVAVVGPSGAGKSSLVGLLLGWHRAAAGTLEVGGRPLEGAALGALRARTAWVDPSVQLWNRSLLDNLLYGSGHENADIDAVLEAAELHSVAQGLQGGMAAALGEGGGLLSGGQGQRVRLGRAMAREAPGLVILDEPFRGLDRDTRARLLARARERWAAATLVYITHDVGHAREFSRVLVLDQGRLAEDGDPAALAAADSLFAQLLAAEHRLRTELWGGPDWRRLRLQDGTLVEAPAEGTP